MIYYLTIVISPVLTGTLCSKESVAYDSCLPKCLFKINRGIDRDKRASLEVTIAPTTGPNHYTSRIQVSVTIVTDLCVSMFVILACLIGPTLYSCHLRKMTQDYYWQRK